MSKKDHKHEAHESHNEVHVETHTESHVSAGSDDVQGRIDELTADLQRVQAEFVNYRRRAESEKAEVLDFAKARIVRDFLSVRDSFDQEQAHRTQFDQVLGGLGVTRFESAGQPFDPHLHNAVAMEDGEGEQEVVVEELQPGYKLGDTVLRHAMVRVGRR